MASTTQQDLSSPRAPLGMIVLALAPFGLGYFLSYFFRAVNAVVAPDLVRELSLSAAELGLLTSAYLFAFAAFQLPLGILLDRYGPRRVQAALVLVGGIGAWLFATGTSALTLTLARGLIGLGFAGGLMAGFKAVVIWVPADRRALANSFVMAAGAIGLIVATAPTEWAVAQYGWRTVIFTLAVVSAVVAAIIFLIVPERARGLAPPEPLRKQVGDLGRIMTDRVFLAVAPLLALTAGTQIAIQTLWAGPWLRDVAMLSRSGVAEMLALAAVAFFIGVLVSGAAADFFGRRGVSLLTTMLVFIGMFVAAQCAIVLEAVSYNFIVWFVFGMSGQVAVLAYPWLSQYFGAELAGRSNAAVNLLLFASAFSIQYLIGAIIDLYPQAATGGYPPEAYRAAFGTFLALQVLTLTWWFVNRRRIAAVERSFRARR